MLTLFTRATAAALLIAAGTAVSTAAYAGWTLDADASRLSFISTKNVDKAEVHYFRELSGAVTDDGEARVEVPLDSVETAIQIRNTRMREFLFETGEYPTLVVSAAVDPAVLETTGHRTQDVELTVSMHGSSKRYAVPLTVVHAGDGSLAVSTLEPLVVDAADFDLGGGIAKLQELAGLASISTAVPVSVQLVFRADD
jgi:polyisoprenoid-binding protein YceI